MQIERVVEINGLAIKFILYVVALDFCIRSFLIHLQKKGS